MTSGTCELQEGGESGGVACQEAAIRSREAQDPAPCAGAREKERGMDDEGQMLEPFEACNEKSVPQRLLEAF